MSASTHKTVPGRLLCAALLAVLLALPDLGLADEPCGVSPQSSTRAAAPWAKWRGFMSAPPGARFYPQTIPGPYPPCAPRCSVSAFNWGYFGARSQPIGYTHVGYYRDVTQGQFPRGF